jgi:hypothetical protein
MVNNNPDDIDNHGLYNVSRSIWSASAAPLNNTNHSNFTYNMEGNNDAVTCKFSAQKSASGVPSGPISDPDAFPTFPDNGVYIDDNQGREQYKWKIELNKVAGPVSAPSNIQCTSSAFFVYGGST